MELTDPRDQLRRQHGRFQSGDNYEEPNEHEEECPVDLAIHLVGLDFPSDKQQRASDDRHLSDRLAGEDKTIVATATRTDLMTKGLS
jgi:hypothetical protein